MTKLIDTAELARITGKSPITIRLDRANRTGPIGQLPYIKLNRSVRYRLEDVERMLEQQRVDPAADGKDA